MSGDGEGNVIDMNTAARMPSPSDVLDNPHAYRPTPEPAEPKRPGRAFARPAASPESPGDGPETFDPESGDYKAFGFAGKGTLPSLRIILKDGSEWSVVYNHLDTHPVNGSKFLPSVPGRKGSMILLRVAGHGGTFLITIAGLHLRLVWEMLLLHRTPWIREVPPNTHAAEAEPVIWSITATPADPGS